MSLDDYEREIKTIKTVFTTEASNQYVDREGDIENGRYSQWSQVIDVNKNSRLNWLRESPDISYIPHFSAKGGHEFIFIVKHVFSVIY